MATWGSSILADDDAEEIHQDYRRLYNQGKEHADVRRALQEAWADSLNDSDDAPVFWFAVALAQWEYGALDDDVLQHVTEIVDHGLGLDRWREAGPKPLANRQKVVREFLTKIRQSNSKPLKRKAEKRYPPIYLPGICLAVRLTDDSYGAALVLETDNRHHTEGFDIVALLEWHSTAIPALDFFQTASRIQPDPDGRLIPVVRKCYARSHNKKWRGSFTEIGQISLPRNVPSRKTGFMDDWEGLVSDLEYYYGLRE